MSTKTSLEVEAKFAVDNDAVVPDLTRIEGVDAVESTVVHHLSARYFDTADLRLTRAKITLRHRTGGKDEGWHLKLPTDAGRLEMGAPLTEPIDGVYTPPAEILEPVRAIVRDLTLSPIAQVDNERTESVLVDANGTPIAEFCDDKVTAWSLLSGGNRTTWREWEVELVPVANEELTELADDSNLQTSVIDSAKVVLGEAGAAESKSPSKLATALGESVNNAPQPPSMADLDENSAAYAVVNALRTNRDRLLEVDPQVRRDEWDSVHQMRVATRELRSLMQTFEGIMVGENYMALEAELKQLASVLGVARDAEVVGERFHMLLEMEDDAVIDEAAAAHLAHDMENEYRKAHGIIIKALNSERYFELLAGLEDLISRPPLAEATDEEDETAGRQRADAVVDAAAADADGPEDAESEDTEAEDAEERDSTDSKPHPVDETVILFEHLDKAYRKLMKRHNTAVEEWDDKERPLREREENFHNMRKAAKKLRYSADAVGRATGLKTKDLYAACKKMQSVLGDFQDSVTSRDKLLDLAEQARKNGEDTFAYGVLYQRERVIGLESLEEYSDAADDIRDAYKKLRKDKEKAQAKAKARSKKKKK